MVNGDVRLNLCGEFTVITLSSQYIISARVTSAGFKLQSNVLYLLAFDGLTTQRGRFALSP